MKGRAATMLAAAGAVLVAVASLCAVSTPVAAAVRQPAAKPAAAAAKCGGEVVRKADGSLWKCTFYDEFTESSLDTRFWTAINTATISARGGQECNTSKNVRIVNGFLQLTALRTAPSTPCGRYETDYSSGMILTQGKFAQTYGRFEMRAKFPPGSGFQPAFWLLPQDPSSGPSYEYGEIDVVEAYSHIPSRVAPHLHFVGTPGTPGRGVRCSIPTSQTAYHTYAVEWTPSLMTFTYDGQTCWSTTWRPKLGYAPPLAAMPKPFDQPFYMIVQLAVGGKKTPTNRPKPDTPFPAVMSVDYIRVWS
jgi:beta-glucanase (GH16 family)